MRRRTAKKASLPRQEEERGVRRVCALLRDRGRGQRVAARQQLSELADSNSSRLRMKLATSDEASNGSHKLLCSLAFCFTASHYLLRCLLHASSHEQCCKRAHTVSTVPFSLTLHKYFTAALLPFTSILLSFHNSFLSHQPCQPLINHVCRGRSRGSG